MVGMISRRLFITRMRGGAAAAAFNLPMFKKKKPKPKHGGRPNKKKKVSNSRYNGNGRLKNTSRGQGITTTTSITSPSPHYPPFPSIGRCNHISNRISSSNDDDNWLVFEILNRLPVKSLTRFKTVCKRWCYLIEKDQKFIDLHLTRSKTRLPTRLFIVVPLPRTQKQEQDLVAFEDTLYIDTWPYKEFHITADLLFEEDDTTLKLVVDTVREIDSSSYNHISKPINGLICLTESHIKNVAHIRNISTGQVSPWFQSSSTVVRKKNVSLDVYAFGFDPVTNEHKLVCVWTTLPNSSASDGFPICGVLTIGPQCSNRWRRIKEVPTDLLNGVSVYVNGVIYLSNCSLNCWASRGGYRPVYLTAFDVGSEKFRTITIPDFILDHPRVHCHDTHFLSFKEIAQLFEVDGNLAMVVKLNNFMFTMYIYEEDDYKDKDEKITGTSTSSSLMNGRWSEVSCITLPSYMRNNVIVEFHTSIGSSDKILVTSIIYGLESRENKKCLSIYCYNWKKHTWTEVDVSGIPSSVPQLSPRSFCTTFSESLFFP